MNDKVRVASSSINKFGAFAIGQLAEGEVVLAWRPLPLSQEQLNSVPPEEVPYLIKIDDQWFLMQSPERYVNHSCNPNTRVIGNADVAARTIMPGEEITSDYGAINGPGNEVFECNCGSENCRRTIFH